MKWEVLVKYNNDNSIGNNVLPKDVPNKYLYELEDKGIEAYEVSVIRSNNKHGHNSWGWDDEDKIILPSDIRIRKAVEMAYVIRDTFNKEKI
jgi:hypothetical protein